MSKRNIRSALAVIFVLIFKEDDTMWSEKMKNGKVRFVERYEDPLTGKSKKVSVVMDKDTAAYRKQATDILRCRIDDAVSSTSAYVKHDDLTLEELVELYRQYQKNAV